VSTNRYAVADVGSNTVHLLAAKSDGERLWPLHEESARLRLGADVTRVGAIMPDNVEATVKAVRRFVQHSRRLDVDGLQLLGTHPVRCAANADSLTKAVLKGAGVRLQRLSPETEALLGYLGTTVDYPDMRPALVVDVGGGSTQLSLVDEQGQFTFVRSVPVGTVNLPVRWVRSEPPETEEAGALREAVAEALAPVTDELEGGFEHGVLIGGLARRLRRAGRLPSRAAVSLPWLEHVNAAALALSADGLEALGAARREDVNMLRAGTTILATLMRNCRVESLALSRNGLREGAILRLARGEALPD
jgi:exopolyphosphatase/pppGpp-phosphohydrolase